MKIILYIFVLKSFIICHCYAKLCSPVSIEPMSLSQPSIEEILRFIKSERVDRKLFKNQAITQKEVIKQIAELHKGMENEDMHLYMPELPQKYGFKIEEHKVQTEDGYILTMQRIPGNGKVVFVMHGLLGSADDWAVSGPEKSLAFILANEGYDVWMGNARGNRYFKKHVRISPSCAEFWDFSWDEIGRYDLPVMIDHTLKHTDRSELIYIGFSQGTTCFFVMCSELPEYNKNISVMVALSPIAFMSHAKSPIPKLISLESNLGYMLAQSVDISSVFSNDILTRALTSVLCGNSVSAKIVCSNLQSLTCGFDGGQLNVTNLPVIMSHFPTGSATKQLVHYGQEMRSGKFRKFDYNKVKNLKLYGTDSPPDYAFENITAPIALFYSDSDWFSNMTDVLTLREKLPNVISSNFVENYSHVDFQWANNVKENVFNKLLDIIKAY